MKYAFVAVLLVLPTVSQAAWWEPTTWFSPAPEIRTEIVEKQVEVIKEVPVEVIKEVEVVKEVVRDNPKQTQRIAELEQELSVAHTQIATYEASSDALTQRITAFGVQTEANMSKLATHCQNLINQAFDEAEDMRDAYNQNIQDAVYVTQQQQTQNVQLQVACAGSWRSASSQQACAQLGQ